MKNSKEQAAAEQIVAHEEYKNQEADEQKRPEDKGELMAFLKTRIDNIVKQINKNEHAINISDNDDFGESIKYIRTGLVKLEKRLEAILDGNGINPISNNNVKHMLGNFETCLGSLHRIAVGTAKPKMYADYKDKCMHFTDYLFMILNDKEQLRKELENENGYRNNLN